MTIREKSKNTANDKSASAQNGNALSLLGAEPERSEEIRGVVGKEPFERAEWNLQMVLAWIIWRTPAALREFWPHYRPAKSVSDVLDPQMHVDKGPPVIARSDAQEALWEKLNSGELSTEGILVGEQDRHVIDRREWRPGGLGYDLGEGWSADEIGVWGEPAKYWEVRLYREDALRIWSPAEGPANSRQVSISPVDVDAALSPTSTTHSEEEPRDVTLGPTMRSFELAYDVCVKEGVVPAGVFGKKQKAIIWARVKEMGGNASPNEKALDQLVTRFQRRKKLKVATF